MVRWLLSVGLCRFESWSDNIHALLDKEKETIVMCHHGVRRCEPPPAACSRAASAAA